MKTRSLLGATLAVLLLAAVGCTSPATPNGAAPVARPGTSATAPATPPSPLEVVESGYRVTGQGNYSVEYGIVLKNPNATVGAVSPTVRITMRDSAGSVVATEDVVLNRIMPGATLAWGGEGVDAHLKRPKTVEFEALDPGANWKTAGQMQALGFKPLVVSGLKATEGDIMTSYAGEVGNPNGATFTRFSVTVLVRDKAGKIIRGVSSDFADAVPANGSAPFRMDIAGLGDYATLEASAQPW